MTCNNKIIAIVGSTGSGKTSLSIKLGLWMNSASVRKKLGISGAEIISADSRQVYRGMDLGTAKISKKETQGIPHHLLDVASPRLRYSAAHFKKQAERIILKLQKQRKIPMVVGGTFFYFKTLSNDISMPPVKPDWKLRSSMEKKKSEELFADLEKLDPIRARSIDRHNKRRLIRAIEIAIKTEKPIPLNEKKSANCDFLRIGIEIPDSLLQKRVASRLRKRFKMGMLGEAEKLRRSGLSWTKMESFGLEYRYMARFIQKKISREEMENRIIIETMQYAKQQKKEFRKMGTLWIKNFTEVKKIVSAFLSNSGA